MTSGGPRAAVDPGGEKPRARPAIEADPLRVGSVPVQGWFGLRPRRVPVNAAADPLFGAGARGALGSRAMADAAPPLFFITKKSAHCSFFLSLTKRFGAAAAAQCVTVADCAGAVRDRDHDCVPVTMTA